jgi:hypothetical protein
MTVGKYLQDGMWYPEYPELGAGVAKWRRVANKAGSIAAMTRADVEAYADAIEKAVRAKHRTLHMRPTPKETGGWYSPPSIARLLRYENPLPMAGDPDWTTNCGCGNLRYYEKHSCNKWKLREKAVYAAAMKAKQGARLLEAAE